MRQAIKLAVAGFVFVIVTSCHDALEPEAPAEAGRGSGKPASSSSAPTRPANLRSTGNTSYSVSLAWDASTHTSSFTYRVRDHWGREITVPGTQTSVTWKYPAHPPLNPGSTYSFSAYAIDAAGNKSGTSNIVSVALPPDNTPPSVPVFTVRSVGTRHIDLAWSSTDDSPFMSYKVTKDGVPITSGWISDSSRVFALLQPGTTYTFTAQARDQFVSFSGGNVSAVSAPFSVTTKVNDGSDVTPPTTPSPVHAELLDGDIELQFWWGASTDNVTPQKVIIYEIYVNGVHENTAVGKTTSTGYGVRGSNEITVIAIDEAGNRSTAGRTTIFIQ